MKLISMIFVGLFLMSPPTALSEDKEAAVRAVIRAFYSAFDDGFVGPADYATEDWNHINPYGGRVGGREATLKEVRAVHQSFLKGTTDTIESLDIRLATEDVAVGTVTSETRRASRKVPSHRCASARNRTFDTDARRRRIPDSLRDAPGYRRRVDRNFSTSISDRSGPLEACRPASVVIS